MRALRLEGIVKSFGGDQLAVAGVDLEVSRGELVVLLGPSGCGKSTLLRMIAGIETPTSGRVYIDGRDVTELPPQKRDVAMVFQSYALYPHMSVRDNLGFGMRMRGDARDEIRRRVEEVAEILGISSLLDRRPSQLSGGQRQRVALGRAIARQAKVFLLDEPLSNLDVQLRLSTRMELARLHRSLDVPMVYVTHDQEEATTLGDRVAVMQSGQILQAGAPMEVYRKPATRFVGGFVGSPRMNFLSGSLASPRGDRIRLDGYESDLPLRPGDAPGASAGRRRVLLGIRPEDIDLAAPEKSDLRARIDVTEPLGREILLHLVPADGRLPAATELRVLVSPDTRAEPGELIGLAFRRDRIHLFDAETEERIDGPPIVV